MSGRRAKARRHKAALDPTTAGEPLTIRWGPIPDTAQDAILADVTPEAKLLFTGGYGAGKTMTLVGKGLHLSTINGDVPGICLVPDYGHFEDTILEKIRSVDPATGRRWFLEEADFHYRITRHGAHLFSWAGGGDWHIMSAIRPASIKGPERAFMICDEPGITTYESWRNAVNRVRHPLARVRQSCGFGTPEGLNWLAQMFSDEHEGSYYRVYTMRTSQNVELLKWQPGYMKQVLENATEQEAKSYLGGEMVNLTGALAYPTFTRAIHYRPDVVVHPRLPLRITFDFNVDPMSCVIGQVVGGPYGRELTIIDAIITGNSWTPQVCDEIIRRYGRSGCEPGAAGGWPGGVVVYGDATGGSRSTTSHQSNYDIIKSMLGGEFAGGGGFRIDTSALSRVNPAERDRLNAVNTLFKNALGQVRCVIRRRPGPAQLDPCYPLVRSLEMTQIAAGTQSVSKPSGETHTHPGDAFGYLVNAEFPAKKPAIINAQSFSNSDV